MKEIDEVKVSDFNKTPFGRVKDDGPNNGERFRKEVLLRAFEKSHFVVVDLDEGMDDGYEYGSSFLHEAFGGLVQHEGMSLDDLKARLTLKTVHKDVELEVWGYIEDPEGC